MRKMLFFFGILLLYEGKGAHIFPSVWCCNPTQEKKQNTSQRKKQIIITSKEDENTTTTPFARTRILMSFNFGNDGATQFQGGGYGCVCLLYFLSPVRIRTREREMMMTRVFGNIFEYIFE